MLGGVFHFLKVRFSYFFTGVESPLEENVDILRGIDYISRAISNIESNIIVFPSGM